MPILDLGTLKIEVKVLTADSNKEFEGLGKKSKQTADEVKEHWQQVSSTLVGTGTSLTRYITLPIIAAGTAAVKYASDMAETGNKVNEIFGSNAKAVDRWADNSLRKMGLAKQSALDYASSFGDLGSAMQLTDEINYKYSTSLVQLTADMASFKNISADRAQTALAGIYTGETESLKGLGIVMNDTNLQAYALANGYTKQYSEMSQAEKVMLRYEYVMDSAKTSMGDFERTSGGMANQTRTLGESAKETGAILGEVIAPTVNDIIVATNGLLEKVKQLNPEARETVVVTALIAAGIGPLLTLVGKGISAYNDITKAVAAANIKMQLSAGAIGAISLAVGVLIGVAVAAVSRYNDITEAANDLADANKKAETAVTDAKKALDDSLVSAEANAKMAQTYTDRLDELSDAQSLDNAQRAESRYLVDQLNQLYPELNAQIDEQTGKIMGGTQAINEQIAAIQARAIATAYEEQYTAVLAAQGDLLYAAAAAETERGLIIDRNGEITQEMNQIQEDFLALTGRSISDVSKMGYETQLAFISGATGARKMLTDWENLDKQIGENKISLSALDRELEKNKTATAAAQKETDIATETFKRLTGSSDALGDSLSGTADDIKGTGDAAAEAETKLKDYTDETINNFGKLPGAVKMSSAQATKNLIENNATMTQWMNDLATLVEKGMDEGVVAKLYEMGPSFRNVVSDLVDDTPEAMQAFEDAMGASGDLTGAKFTTGVKNSTKDVTGTLSDMTKEVDTWTAQTTEDIAEVVDVGVIAKLKTINPAWIGIIAELIRANNTNLVGYKVSMLAAGTESGNNFYLGVKSRTTDRLDDYYLLGYMAGKKYVAGYNDAQESKSPARQGTKSADNWYEGVAIGTINNTNKLIALAQDQARIPIKAMSAEIGNLPRILGGALPVTSPVYNNTTSVKTSVVTRGKVEQKIIYSSQPKTSYERQIEQKRASKNLAKEIG